MRVSALLSVYNIVVLIIKYHHFMEQLNRVELIGHVGAVRRSDFNGKSVVNFSLATNSVYTARDLSTVVETTWHRVTCWCNPDEHQDLIKGSAAHVIGRLKQASYIASDGTERTSVEILASSVEVVNEKLTSQRV